MSQSRLPRTELLEALEKELDAAGYSYREKCGRKHGRILVDVDGKEEPIFVSGTPSDHRAIKNAVGHLRRKIREWKGEMEQSVEIIEPSNALVYNGVVIRDRDKMLSLTDMWKASKSPRGRAPNDWRNLGSTKDFAECIAAMGNAGKSGNDLFCSNRGGSEPGTWAHWQIAMAYAKYLSPKFHAWCNEVVYSYMTGEPMEEVAPSVPATQSDELSALLEMLSDLQSAVMAAIQRSDSHAIDRVEDTKNALLHYMKVQLKEPSYAFFDDVRTRNKAAWERDKLLVKEVRDLRSAVSGLLTKAEQPLLARQFVWADWFDHDKIYQTYFPSQVIPNRRFLSQAVSKSLDSYCKRRQRGFDMQSRRIGGRNVNLWHKDSVGPWIEVHGREIVRTHLAKCRRSGDVVEFRKTK